MKRKEQPPLFGDSLRGQAGPGWADPPRDFRTAPGPVRVCLLDTATRQRRHPLPAAGDATWSRYCVEFEFMPKSVKGYTGLSFHVQPNGDACNFHFPSGCSGRNEAFQTMYIFGKSMPWQLHPESQGYAQFRRDAWSKVRLDVGATNANLFVNGGPVLTMFDLPFKNGGIQLWSWHGQVFVRELRVTDLSSSRVVPVFKNPWLIYANTNLLGQWRAALANDDTQAAADSPPQGAVLDRLTWQTVRADRRGVVNLSEAFRDNNTNATAYATTEVICDGSTHALLHVTYTDQLALWCNGEQVFTGEPRGWGSPNREAHFGGRLVPDEYSVALRLRAGTNKLLAKTTVVDPWGWGFWMRMDEDQDRTTQSRETSR